MTPNQLNAQGLSLARQSRFPEAIAAFRNAIALEPNSPEAHYNLAKALKDSGHLAESIIAYHRTLDLQPNSAPAWQNLANALQESGKIPSAIEAYQRALSLEPHSPGAHGMLARLLHEAGRIEESIPHFRALVQLLPTNPEPTHALGVALHDLNRLDEATDAYRACLTLDPNHAHSAYALGLIYLTRGDFQTGWKLYESRRRVPGPKMVRDYPQPFWDGSPLAGKRILLHAEQGLGDTLQFIRYAPLVTQKGGQVILQCPAPLTRLLSNQLTINQVIADGAPLPPFDVHCPLLSLPFILGTTVRTITQTVPYLSPDPADVAKWNARLGPPTKRRIGIVWAGNATHRNDRNRSIPAGDFDFLTRLPDVELVTLQKGGSPPSEPLRGSLLDFTADLGDLADTAALVANLDLVVTVDTAVAHLAGGMGKPVWVLLPFAADWRWLLGREDSPWYPTLRLYRQSVPGDWRGPLQRVMADLRC